MGELLRPTVKRDLSLWSVQSWQRGYEVELPKTLGWRYPILFHYDGTRVNFYHCLSDFTHFKHVITQRLIDDRELFRRLDIDFRANIEKLRHHTGELTSETLEDLSRRIGCIMAHYMFVVSDAFVQRVPEAWESRRLSEGILYEVDAHVEGVLASRLRKKGKDSRLAHLLTGEEASALCRGDDVDLAGVERRRDSYILVGDRLTVGTPFSTFCNEHGWKNPEEEQSVQGVRQLSGTVAHPGHVQGRVMLIRTKDDLGKVEDGYIVVAVMTNAAYTSAIRRAGAIITDEGGMTCHAAIVARELAKPCIIGTRMATRVLKNGDLVDVDAEKGTIVKIR